MKLIKCWLNGRLCFLQGGVDIYICCPCMSSSVDTDGGGSLAVHFTQSSPVVVRIMSKTLIYTSLSSWPLTPSHLSMPMPYE